MYLKHDNDSLAWEETGIQIILVRDWIFTTVNVKVEWRSEKYTAEAASIIKKARSSILAVDI